MIGGRDIILPTARGTDALDLAIRLVTRLWPGVVLEDAVTGESFRGYSELSFAGRREILAFRDEQAAQLWEQLGADPSLDGTLIHFLLGDRELTVAIDADPPPQIKSFVKALRQGLGQDLFAGPPGQEAA